MENINPNIDNISEIVGCYYNLNGKSQSIPTASIKITDAKVVTVDSKNHEDGSFSPSRSYVTINNGSYRFYPISDTITKHPFVFQTPKFF